MLKTDITVRGGGYEAEFRSDLGGNCYRLHHIRSGAEILRTPDSEEELGASMYLYGNPILFPPNRIRDGAFEFEGRSYQFPINEKKTGCHIHGELYKTPFEVAELSEDSVSFYFEAKAFEYLGFPHAFSIIRSYKLAENGMTETVKVSNFSDTNMQFMLAFHTTFNIPFVIDGSADECYAKIPIGKEQLRDENYLPTLSYAEGGERAEKLNAGEYRICDSSLSALYESADTRAVIIDASKGYSIVYEADEAYKYRMLWRGDASSFLVIEPQTCAIDCFHLEAPPQDKGLIVIPPHESVVLNTRFALE